MAIYKMLWKINILETLQPYYEIKIMDNRKG